MYSCAPQKKIVSYDEQTIKTETQIKENKYKFNLSFLSNIHVKKTVVDSIGNIHFCDSILEKQIKTSLNLDSTQLINIALADTVRNLMLNGDMRNKLSGKIKSLDGLQYFKELEYLYISFNSVSDLSPLQNLYKLKHLTAQDNQIENIEPLKKLTSLKYLTLYSNKVTDITTLSNLTNLEDICLWDNSVSNIDVFKNLVNLQEINLGKNNITDISPLTNCKKLHAIWIPFNPITNPELLSNFSQTLKVLSIAGCKLKNIDYLEDCKKMRDL